METIVLLVASRINLFSFNFLASLINGNLQVGVLPLILNYQYAFNFLASLINGNRMARGGGLLGKPTILGRIRPRLRAGNF